MKSDAFSVCLKNILLSCFLYLSSSAFDFLRLPLPSQLDSISLNTVRLFMFRIWLDEFMGAMLGRCLVGTPKLAGVGKIPVAGRGILLSEINHQPIHYPPFNSMSKSVGKPSSVYCGSKEPIQQRHSLILTIEQVRYPNHLAS